MDITQAYFFWVLCNFNLLITLHSLGFATFRLQRQILAFIESSVAGYPSWNLSFENHCFQNV